MTADADIFETVVSVLQRSCGVQVEVSSGTRLAEDLGLDSVGLLALALELENHYQQLLGEDPASPPRTVGDIVALIAEGIRNRGEPR